MALNSNTINKRVDAAIRKTPGLEHYIARKNTSSFVAGIVLGIAVGAAVVYVLVT